MGDGNVGLVVLVQIVDSARRERERARELFLLELHRSALAARDAAHGTTKQEREPE